MDRGLTARSQKTGWGLGYAGALRESAAEGHEAAGEWGTAGVLRSLGSGSCLVAVAGGQSELRSPRDCVHVRVEGKFRGD